MKPTRWLPYLLLLAAGCAEELGPEPMPTARVAGRVHVGDRPAGDGWVEFLPTGGTVGRLRSARIGPNGSFRAERVPVGTVALRVVLARPERLADPALRPLYSRLGQAYFIRRTISAQPPALDIDLGDEMIGAYSRAAPPP